VKIISIIKSPLGMSDIVSRLDVLLLTLLNDISKDGFSFEKVICGTIPPSIPKLVLAFTDGHLESFGDSSQDSWIVFCESSLLLFERNVHEVILFVEDGIGSSGIENVVILDVGSCSSKSPDSHSKNRTRERCCCQKRILIQNKEEIICM
jgi:hypothetical protein